MNKPTAILGPHVSILGPFSPGDVTESMVERIRMITDALPPISCTFSQFGVFPDALFLHLSPHPIGPFENLRGVILRELPWYRPEFPEHIFHLSLACGFELSTLPGLMARAHDQLDRFLPLKVTLGQLQLTDRMDGVWKTRTSFILRQ